MSSMVSSANAQTRLPMTSQNSVQPLPSAGRPLRRILGQGFGVAVIFGGMVGVGILRLPGVIAGQVGTAWLILAVWVAGALYALMGAVNLAEVATALPQAGGFYIYARRAFGPMPGFVQGWADWLDNCAVIAYGVVTASNYAGALMPALAAWPRMVALSILAAFLALHMAGLPLSSRVQQVASSVTAVTFLVLAVACFCARRCYDRKRDSARACADRGCAGGRISRDCGDLRRLV